MTAESFGLSRAAGMRTARILACVVSLFTAAAAATVDASGECPEGEVVHWIADFCMLVQETDDEIAVSECIAKERATVPKDACHTKRHYKAAMCHRVVARDGGSVDRCVADRRFMGSTVKNGGAGYGRVPPALVRP